MVITTAGLTVASARLIGNNGGKFATHLGVGTGSRKETAGDTALAAELLPSSGNRLTVAANGTAASFSGTFRVQVRVPRSAFAGTAALTIREAGLFDSATGGKMIARVTLKAGIRLTTNNVLSITITGGITPKA